jgi:DNA-binding NarL/FixJ family response regulator
MISLLLVEHPSSVRRALSARLVLEPDLCAIGEADGPVSAVRLAEVLHPDVIVLDAEMFGLDLREAVSALRVKSPTSRVVILSMDNAAVSRSIGVGSGALVGKSREPRGAV